MEMIRVDIDMPKNCVECPFHAEAQLTISGISKEYCKAFYKDAMFDNRKIRQDWCPISEIDKPKDRSEEYVKLSDIQKFPIRLTHYDKENGNIHFVLGIETVIEYIEGLDRYK